MGRLVLIDGNSIMNRAFYGIMGSKMLTTSDGKYTNAVYGFLAIMFKVIDDLNPDYMAVAFDLKAPTARHKMYEGYKATRKGMPNELAEQMPIIKEILHAMNIDIIEKEGYEADDVLGTLSRFGENNNLDVTILSGDRDTFQLATDKVTIRIPRTKAGKTETEEYNREKIIENYGIEPKQLIEVKGLQGDTSDNIPGVPGIGEKTALNLIKKFGSIDNLYSKLEKGESELKGKQKENIENNKDLAILSRTLGTINLEVPIEDTLEKLKVEEWNKQEVLRIFKDLKFNRYIERFNLQSSVTEPAKNEKLFEIEEISDVKNIDEKILKKIKINKRLIYFLGKKDCNKDEKIIKKEISSISIYVDENIVYYIKINEINEFINIFKNIFEDDLIEKFGYHLSEDYVMLKEIGINMKNLRYDAKVAAYILNPTSKYNIETIIEEYLNIDTNSYLENEKEKNNNSAQINLFDTMQESNIDDSSKMENSLYTYCISKLEKETIKKLDEIGSLGLFSNIEMPLVEVLGQMQFNRNVCRKRRINRIWK